MRPGFRGHVDNEKNITYGRADAWLWEFTYTLTYKTELKFKRHIWRRQWGFVNGYESKMLEKVWK